MIDEFERADGCVALFGSYDAEPAAPGWISRYRNILHHHVHQRGNEAEIPAVPKYVQEWESPFGPEAERCGVFRSLEEARTWAEEALDLER